jgi:hypothetical protein
MHRMHPGYAALPAGLATRRSARFGTLHCLSGWRLADPLDDPTVGRTGLVGHGGDLLALILTSKFCNHQLLNRQSEAYAREGIDLDVSTLADWVGACTATLASLVTLIRAHVLAAERIHGDDTTVPVLAKGKTITGRLWTYVRDDQPFAGRAALAPMLFYSRDRGGMHPAQHTSANGGILHTDPSAGSNDFYGPERKPGRILEHCAGRTDGGSSSSSLNWLGRRLPSRRCSASMRYSTSSAALTACHHHSACRSLRAGSAAGFLPEAG